MYEVQKFAIENIYSASSQDRQFCFKLYRATKKDYPVKRFVNLYSVTKNLPNTSSFFHAFVIGNLNPSIVNLIKQKREWFKDVWVNAQEDMNARNIVIQLYNDLGVNYPRVNVFYSFIDESSIVIAMEVNDALKRAFDINSFMYFRLYTNTYYLTPEYNGLSIKNGIKCETSSVFNNADKLTLQNKIANYMLAGGDAIVYVNGYYTDHLTLNIPDNVFVEYVYDQSIVSKEKYTIGSLRTFESTKDNYLKFLLFRDKSVDYIQYHDDVDIYICTDNELVTKGVYYYKHTDYAMRNVTDKDYSLSSPFINNQASSLSAITTGSIQDKILVVYNRRSGINKPLVYSSLKIHELYKLPQNVELDVLSNMNYTITELRSEFLENSSYFNLSSQTKLKDITNTLATQAIGYNGVKYYYANTPTVVNNAINIDVPLLFMYNCYAYEYDSEGVFIHRDLTNGPMYTVSSNLVKYVEFFQGQSPVNYEPMYANNATVNLRNSEYVIISAYFDNGSRITNWEDITNNATKVTVNNNVLNINEASGKLVRVFYLDQPYTYDLNVPLVDGVLYFPLTLEEDRGNGEQNYLLDLPFSNVEVFLNGYRLNYGIDFFVKYPYISVCSKMYFDYSKEVQSLHFRLSGYTLDRTKINSEEIVGFINNGVLTRNNYYDIRDDRVFSMFVKGRLQNRDNLTFAEEDNTVRLTNPLNGIPYTLAEYITSVKDVTGVETLPIYYANKELDSKISDLYKLIYPEPAIDKFNVIANHYFLFSPLISKMIQDGLDGDIIPYSFYMNPYNDADILQLIETKYKILYELDPIRQPLPLSIVEIHPSPLNDIMMIPLHLYRFITNVVRIVTNNNINRINMSGFVKVTTTNPENYAITAPHTGGVTIIPR